MALHLKPFCPDLRSALVHYIEDSSDRDNNCDRLTIGWRSTSTSDRPLPVDPTAIGCKI
ncbi:hypothetical protein [Chamaesiphon sp.]|uniref:hypothetical protein n=1 Tax=Chamaesiphon sp. TaxID=2814140 RepID=UPI0035942F7C